MLHWKSQVPVLEAGRLLEWFFLNKVVKPTSIWHAVVAGGAVEGVLLRSREPSAAPWLDSPMPLQDAHVMGTAWMPRWARPSASSCLTAPWTDPACWLDWFGAGATGFDCCRGVGWGQGRRLGVLWPCGLQVRQRFAPWVLAASHVRLSATS